MENVRENKGGERERIRERKSVYDRKLERKERERERGEKKILLGWLVSKKKSIFQSPRS